MEKQLTDEQIEVAKKITYGDRDCACLYLVALGLTREEAEMLLNEICPEEESNAR